jgi:hypothetical protein
VGAYVGWKALVERSFAPAIHVLSTAMGKQKSSFPGLQEFPSLYQVNSLQIYEVLNDDDGIGEVEPRGLLDSELPDNVLQGVEERFVHALLVANPGDFLEEETWN